MVRIALAVALLSAALSPHAAAEPDCGGPVPCSVGERRYHARPPEGWDGARRLPVLVHFHGWGRTGADVLRNARITEPAADAGLLLIAPDGRGKSWAFWGAESPDIAFADRLIADVARRWPVERERVFVSGFSYGGAMAWRLACARGPAFAAYLPIAGGLWGQAETVCPGGPARVLHVHGLDDQVFGLPIRPMDRIDDGVLLWRRVNHTTEMPQSRYRDGGFDCRFWEGREDGRDVTLCTHPGGHAIPEDWLGRVLPDLLAAHHAE